MPKPSAAERFHAKYEVNTNTGCWEWTAYVDRLGYGRFSWNGTMGRAHRFAYALLVGPIPEGLELDHLCKVRCCVNPAHLEPVTRQENIRRSNVGRPQAERTHCPQGHPYDEKNTRYKLYAKGCIGRVCRACARDYMRRKRAESRTA